jgi:hypothetical protein
MSKVRPPYPAEFRQQMVELVRAGRSPAQLSREFGVTAQSSPTGSARPPLMTANLYPARKA